MEYYFFPTSQRWFNSDRLDIEKSIYVSAAVMEERKKKEKKS